MSDWGGDRLKEDKRWVYGTPPAGNANYAWIQHFIHHLAPAGTAGFVLANVSLDSESPTEKGIRENLIKADLIDCIVSLPGKLFYSNPIAVCLWIINRDKSATCFREHKNEILFIDGSKLYKEVDRTHNSLPDESIKTISETYNNWRYGNGLYVDKPGFSKSVNTARILSEGFNLFPANYTGVESSPNVSSRAQLKQKLLTSIEGSYESIRKLDNIKSSLSQILEFEKINYLAQTIDFEEIRLGEILEPSNDRLGDQPEPEILTCTEKAGLVFQRQRFAKRIATSDTSNYKTVKLTDIVYNPYLLWAGAIDQCWIVDFGITSPAYEVFRIKQGYDRSLVGRLVKSEMMIKRYNGISIGTIQRRRRAPAEKFLDITFNYPKVEFQDQINEITELLQNAIGSSRQIAENFSIGLHSLLDLWMYE